MSQGEDAGKWFSYWLLSGRVHILERMGKPAYFEYTPANYSYQKNDKIVTSATGLEASLNISPINSKQPLL